MPTTTEPESSGDRKVKVCRLCESDRHVLTPEHIPPKSLGNAGRHRAQVLRASSGRVEELEATDGVALSVLCRRCNEKFGSWLGTSFADFAKQVQTSGRFLSPHGSDFASSVEVYPSRVLRHFYLNFLCIQPDGDENDWSALRTYIKSRVGEPPQNAPAISLYYNSSNTYRLVPVGGQSALGQRRPAWFGAEIAAPGLGAVFTIGDTQDSNPVITRRLLDISDWARYEFGEKTRIVLELPYYRVETPHPLGFGSPKEVTKWQDRNMIIWLASRFHADLGEDLVAILWRPQPRRR